jgi:hypothetical protein
MKREDIKKKVRLHILILAADRFSGCGIPLGQIVKHVIDYEVTATQVLQHHAKMGARGNPKNIRGLVQDVLKELATQEALVYTRQRPEQQSYERFDKFFRIRITKARAAQILRKMEK